jgi:hypothetical protein
MVGPPDAGFFLPLEDELIADEVGGSIGVGFGSRFASESCLACLLADVFVVGWVDISRRDHAFAQSWRRRSYDDYNTPKVGFLYNTI